MHTMLKESDIAGYSTRCTHRTYTPEFKAELVAACQQPCNSRQTRRESCFCPWQCTRLLGRARPRAWVRHSRQLNFSVGGEKNVQNNPEIWESPQRSCFGRDFAIEALKADLISEGIALHNAYSPVLLAHQLRADYKACFNSLFTASLGNILIGMLVSMFEPFGLYRLIGLVVACLGIYMCLKMIATYPRINGDILSQNTPVEEQKVEGVPSSNPM
ncbi:MAG: hypothetical protein Q7K57_32275 [Burkholderiaceae bacterium]|nr:hypothetical protein [Burkholderiaceae bacterium]